MIYPILRRLLATLFMFTIAAPAAAEKLDPKWQVPRDYFNLLSDQACAGDERAHRELSSAALTQQNPVALNDLGWLLSSQQCSYSKEDLSYAAFRYKESAQGGYPLGQSNYAEHLMEGDVIPRDPVLAKQYFHSAMDAGYGNAAVILGLYYLSAEYLPIDDTKAIEYYNRAVTEGADPAELAKLKTELDKINENGEFAMNEIDERQQLFTNEWGFGYGEARWDYAPNGTFQARVYVGVYEDVRRFYLGIMREAPETMIKLTGITVEKSDGKLIALDLGFCTAETCTIESYSDNFGKPGAFVTVQLPKAGQRQMLEAVKSGKYIIFKYVTSIGPKQFTLSLKGSRKAIEQLERKHGLSPSPVKPTQKISFSAYNAALKTLANELNRVWSPKGGSLQAGSQRFATTASPCIINTFVDHPNTGKTTYQFNLGQLDPDRITWEPHFYFGLPSFFTANAMQDRKVVKLWTNYPDGTDAYQDTSDVALYIGENGNFMGIKPHLETAIRYCRGRS